MKPPAQDHRLTRVDPTTLTLANDWDIPVRVFANERIPLGREAVDELINVLSIQSTVDLPDPAITDVVLTPDFHKGAGIPIGTVLRTRGFAVPQAIGNDVNCGMRLMATSLRVEQVTASLDAIERELRHLFFEGGRGIALRPAQREALLRFGLPGLLESSVGADAGWRLEAGAVRSADLERMHGRGGYPAALLPALADYVSGAGGPSYDSLIGSLGGGNHFAEIQYVRRIHDRAAAHAWGLSEGQVVVMVHAGSLGLGHIANSSVLELMQAIYPGNLPRPANGIYPLPAGEHAAAAFDQFTTALRNAANFAFGNRFYLSLMMQRGLAAAGELESRVIYDAPHNLMWPEADGLSFIHRKGATPAGGWEQVAGTAYEHWGEPVIVPGSMGAPSFLLLGSGHPGALCSACHGAGRLMSRGAAMQVDDVELDAFLAAFRIVTPLDPRRPDVRGRRDILSRWRQEVKQEAPFAYKDIAPVIETLRDGGVARPVAELFPLLTVKG
jgi:tRNA-splicing ligase RtcB